MGGSKVKTVRNILHCGWYDIDFICIYGQPLLSGNPYVFTKTVCWT